MIGWMFQQVAKAFGVKIVTSEVQATELLEEYCLKLGLGPTQFEAVCEVNDKQSGELIGWSVAIYDGRVIEIDQYGNISVGHS